MITLTERALKELRRIVQDQNLPESTVLRLGVKGGGCSGFSYSLGFDDPSYFTRFFTRETGLAPRQYRSS